MTTLTRRKLLVFGTFSIVFLFFFQILFLFLKQTAVFVPQPLYPTTSFRDRFDIFQYKSTDSREKIWNDYLEFHRRSLEDFECSKYVVFIPAESGFGNRLQMLVASFQLAVVTGRTFLVHWTQPCNISELFEDPPLNWYFDQLVTPQRTWFFNSSQIQIDMEDRNQTAEFFRTTNYTNYFKAYHFVIINHWSSFESWMRENSLYSDVLNLFFGNNSVQVSCKIIVIYITIIIIIIILLL